MKNLFFVCLPTFFATLLLAAAGLVSCQQPDLLADAPAPAMTRSQNGCCLDPGAIPERIELNRTQFDLHLDIPSLRDVEVVDPAYSWQMLADSVWTDCQASGTSYHASVPSRHITKFRRKVATPCEFGYTNECTVVNYAYREDPFEGTGPYDAIKIGAFDRDFFETLSVDTQGPNFRDIDRLQYCGNDAFLEFEITRRMYVEVLTSAYNMNIWLDLQNLDTGDACYSDISSGPVAELSPGNVPAPFPAFDTEEYPVVLWQKVFDLAPGKYRIQIQGCRVYNSGADSGVLCLRLRGTVYPVAP